MLVSPREQLAEEVTDLVSLPALQSSASPPWSRVSESTATFVGTGSLASIRSNIYDRLLQVNASVKGILPVRDGDVLVGATCQQMKSREEQLASIREENLAPDGLVSWLEAQFAVMRMEFAPSDEMFQQIVSMEKMLASIRAGSIDGVDCLV